MWAATASGGLAGTSGSAGTPPDCAGPSDCFASRANGFFSPWMTEGFTFAPFGDVGGASATAAPGHLFVIRGGRLVFTAGLEVVGVVATAAGLGGSVLVGSPVEKIDFVLNASPIAPEP